MYELINIHVALYGLFSLIHLFFAWNFNVNCLKALKKKYAKVFCRIEINKIIYRYCCELILFSLPVFIILAQLLFLDCLEVKRQRYNFLPGRRLKVKYI